MTTTDVDACVVDTNVLVYSTVSGNPWHQQARQWLSALQAGGVRLCLTTQILREYAVILTRATVFERSFTVDQVMTQIEALLPSFVVLDEPAATADLARTGAPVSGSRKAHSRCQCRRRDAHPRCPKTGNV